MLLVFVLLILLSTSLAFDDSRTRHMIFPMAAAAYSDQPEDCLANTFKNYTLIRKVLVPCDDQNNDCFGFLAVAHDPKAIILSFRGTDSIQQLLNELGHISSDSQVNFLDVGAVGKYFKNAFDVVWHRGLFQAFAEIRADFPSYELWVTGHSLGGSIASLAALFIGHLSLFDKTKIRLVTFGQPRTGDTSYARAVDREIANAYRIVHLRDIVPHVPPQIKHYAHHAQEIFYPNDMAAGRPFMVCHGDEDVYCSDSYFAESVNDHLVYYGERVSAFGLAGCVSGRSKKVQGDVDETESAKAAVASLRPFLRADSFLKKQQKTTR